MTLHDLLPDDDDLWEPCNPAIERVPTDVPPALANGTQAGREAWLERWAPRCPDDNRQIVRRPEGFRERNPRELELRVLLGCCFEGACQVVVDERPTEVYVRVILCAEEERYLASRRERHYTDCPVRVWLNDRLGDRAVIDVDSDEQLDEYRPYIVGHNRQPDGGYHRSNRRCR